MRITQEMATQTVGRDYPKRTAQPLNTSGVYDDVKVEVEDWVKREVGRGLYMILAERLPYAPKLDEIKTLTQAWSFVFKRRLCLAFEKVDAPRIQEAFCRAMELKKWPAASYVADLMPPRPQRPAVPHLPQRTARGYDELKKIQEMLKH